MKVEVTKLDKLKRKVKIFTDGEDFGKMKTEIYLEIGKQLKVPGFRPGTAPLEVLTKHHAKLLKEEYLKKALPYYYSFGLKEKNIFPASLPHIFDIELDDKSLTFCAEFEAKPEIEMSGNDYKGIKIKDTDTDVKEDEIEKARESLKDNIKKIYDKEPDDLSLAKWSGYSNAEKLKEALKAELHLEKLRQRRQNIEVQISRHLLDNVKVDVPGSEIKRRSEELLNSKIYELKNNGVSDEDINKYRDDLKEKLQSVAEHEVKLSYILEAIAKKENINAENNLGHTALGFILSCAKYE
ncbi:MAG: trigger factor [Candidatus Omnitrophota bacterium]